jgi:methylthioribose-1-phosphate isomerase
VLPHRFTTIRLTTLADVARAIATMQVRGAPLIGATAAYGVALALRADASDEVLEPSAHPLALDRVILHQQDARGRHRCPKPANQPMQPFAVDRLGEIAGRAKRDAPAVLIHDRDHDDRNLGELRILPQSG